MNEELQVRRKREFGHILTDPFRFIFRNLKVVSLLLAFFVFVPMVIAYISSLLLQANVFQSSDDFTSVIISFVCLALFGLLASHHIQLGSYSLLRSVYDTDGSKMEYKKVLNTFKSLYLRSLGFSLIVFFILLMTGTIAFLIVFTATVFGVLFILLWILGILFYFYPLSLMAYRVYLDQPECTIFQAFSIGKKYIDGYWGSTIGVFLVSGIISNLLQYTFLIPLMIILMVVGLAVSFELNENHFGHPIMILYFTIAALGFSYLILYSNLAMLLKSFDIEERITGRYLIAQIEKIGTVKQGFFENEGEF